LRQIITSCWRFRCFVVGYCISYKMHMYSGTWTLLYKKEFSKTVLKYRRNNVHVFSCHLLYILYDQTVEDNCLGSPKSIYLRPGSSLTVQCYTNNLCGMLLCHISLSSKSNFYWMLFTNWFCFYNSVHLVYV
jgi:hypothetical protein